MKTLWIFTPLGWDRRDDVEEDSFFKTRDYYISGQTGKLCFHVKDGTEIETSMFYIENRKEDRYDT